MRYTDEVASMGASGSRFDHSKYDGNTFPLAEVAAQILERLWQPQILQNGWMA
jgi:hypothetical protein